MTNSPIFSALAVAGSADRDLLAHLLNGQLDSQTLEELRQSAQVVEVQGRFSLQAEYAATQLHALERDDFLHFRRLHERALQWLGERLQQGDMALEPQVATLFVRLGERLLAQAPQQLSALLDMVRHFPLAVTTRQYLRWLDGVALRNLERYREAEVQLTQLLREADLNLVVRGKALATLGVTYFWQGQLQPALDSYTASLTIWQETGDQVQEGGIEVNLGILFYELHDYAQAEHHLLRAQLLCEATQTLHWLPSVWNELGLLYRDQGRWDEALAAFARSLAQRSAEGAFHRVGVILNNIGEVLLLQGKLAEARQAFLESLEKMTVDLVRIDAWLNLGLLHQFLNEWELAQAAYEQALTTAQRIERHDILPSIHYRLADLARQQGQPERALPYLLTGIEQIEATRTPLRDEGIKISLLGRWQQLYAMAVLLLVEQQRIDEALTLVERARARALIELLGAGKLTDEQLCNAAAIRQQLPAEMALIEFFATGLPGSHTALIAQLPAEAAGLRMLLLPPERLLLFCISNGAIHCHELPLQLSQIDAQHFQRADGRLRGIVPVPGQSLRPMRRWHDLGAVLFARLRPHLVGKQHLVFVPHALLHYLPFHALADLDELTQVTATSVSYAPSASIFLAKLVQGRTAATSPALPNLAIGVDGGGLTHAEAEARWVAQQLGGELLIGAQAAPAAVLQAMSKAAVIHISCHGLFRQRRPMQSALLVYDGEVSAADLLASVQLQARLVTLSACDTGLNRLEPGDEPLGLTRAVLGCGAHSLLATLWPVHELPTRLFMTHFYSQWRQGQSKASALALAQRWLITRTQEQLWQQLADFGLTPEQCDQMLALFQQMLPGEYPFAHPYYWAPFVLIGDPL